MSDSLCVGVCMIDWEAGVCLGCGRSAAEIDASAPESTSATAPARDASASASFAADAVPALEGSVG